MSRRGPGRHDRRAGGLPPGAAAAIRDALDAERQETLARITALRREFDGIVDSSALVATDDEHDPEGATIAFERAQLAALLDQARQHLADLDDALDRLRRAATGGASGAAGRSPPGGWPPARPPAPASPARRAGLGWPGPRRRVSLTRDRRI